LRKRDANFLLMTPIFHHPSHLRYFRRGNLRAILV
jgi:hypothetical protein